jgi:hypothetical protein
VGLPRAGFLRRLSSSRKSIARWPSLDALASADIFKKLTPGFDTGALKPFAVDKSLELACAKDAYHAVHAGSRERIVLSR